MIRRLMALAALTVSVSLYNCLPASAQIEDALSGTKATPVAGKNSGSVDFALFAKACGPYISSSYQSVSDLKFQLVGKTPDQKANFSAKINVLAASSGKYRSGISFVLPDGSAGPMYQIVNDGTNVSVSNTKSQEYSVSPSADFQDSGDSFLATGLFGGLMRGEFSALAKLFDDPQVRDADPAEIEDGIRKGLKSKGGEITQTTETVGGTEMTIFVLSMPSGKFRFMVDPASAQMRRVEMKTSTDEGLDITITETITSIKTPGTINKDSFEFSAPGGSKKVEKVSISPFGGD